VRRVLIPGLLVLLVAAGIAFEVVNAKKEKPLAKPSPPLPTKVLQPPAVSLADLRGKPALVNFWASWCDPCREEASSVAAFDRSLHGKANLVGVDYTDQPGPARAFIRKYGWTFPILSDPDGIAGARFGFSGLPTTVVLDSRGRVVETLRGPQSAAELRQAVAAAGGA
jgi:cytochrome c biogenesis protein CcmG/thiol:disulfide interchange protein DsbE